MARLSGYSAPSLTGFGSCRLRFFYSLLFYLLLPFAVARLLWRSRFEPLYRATMRQRFGFVDRCHDAPIWVHAVSAGETNAAAPMVRRLLDQGLPVMMTTMTPTGRERVRSLFGDDVHHAYAPYDVPDAVARFFERVRPRLLVVVDTELWPNILSKAQEERVPALLVNARLSERSARRYARVGGLTREMLDSLAAVACQTKAQGERFVRLGLPREKLEVTGSIKFDVGLAAERANRLEAIRDKIGNRRLLLGASTHAGEEEAMIGAWQALESPGALLVLAPRHPNRNSEVLALCRRAGLKVVLHSTGERCAQDTDVLIVDTMGELMDFYQVSEIAFVGGSLANVGGHNPMEPALAGVPIVMGPHLFNIDEIRDRFVEAGAMKVVESKVDLASAVKQLFENAGERAAMVAAAADVMTQNRGALDRVMTLILDLLNRKNDLKSSVKT